MRRSESPPPQRELDIDDFDSEEEYAAYYRARTDMESAVGHVAGFIFGLTVRAALQVILLVFVLFASGCYASIAIRFFEFAVAVFLRWVSNWWW